MRSARKQNLIISYGCGFRKFDLRSLQMGAAMFSVDTGYFSLIKKHPLTLTAMSENDFVGADDLLSNKVLVML